MQPPIEGVVLITGASSGIGRELARRLAFTASAIALVARRADRLEALRDELTAAHRSLRVLAIPCDLADLSACRAMLDRVEREFGPVDVLVNNAGFGDRCYFEASAWPKLEEMIDLNVTALTYLTRRVIAGMIERRRGGILNISSMFGITYAPGVAAYIGTKYYVTGFTHTLRSEVAGTGVVVTQVCPGPVDTEFEDVAQNQTSLASPTFLQLSAGQCADEALRGFGRGRAVVYPGLAIRLLAYAKFLTPGFVYRWVAAVLSKQMRQRRPPATSSLDEPSRRVADERD